MRWLWRLVCLVCKHVPMDTDPLRCRRRGATREGCAWCKVRPVEMRVQNDGTGVCRDCVGV